MIEWLIPGAIEKLIVMDASHDMVQACKNANHGLNNNGMETMYLVGDEEFLPIKERFRSWLYLYLIIIYTFDI